MSEKDPKSPYIRVSPIVNNPSVSTLTKFIFKEEFRHNEASGELRELLNTLQIIAKTINAMIGRISLAQLYGVDEDERNPKRFQTLANEIFVNILTSSRSVGIMISQESKNVIDVKKETKGKYIVAFDPLDGHSNLDSGISVGSIFLIMVKSNGSLPEVEDALNPKNRIVGAGYVVYGSATLFVFSTGEGVNEFVLDPQIGEFFLSEKDIKIPKRGTICSINYGYSNLWEDAVREYVWDRTGYHEKKSYHFRYVGSLVADIHRTLKHGGIFLYPGNKEKPKGKLRLLYECKPVAFIITVAGGLATDGSTPILDIQPTDLHQKSPIFIGSKCDVEDVMGVILKYRNKGEHKYHVFFSLISRGIPS